MCLEAYLWNYLDVCWNQKAAPLSSFNIYIKQHRNSSFLLCQKSRTSYNVAFIFSLFPYSSSEEFRDVLYDPLLHVSFGTSHFTRLWNAECGPNPMRYFPFSHSLLGIQSYHISFWVIMIMANNDLMRYSLYKALMLNNSSNVLQLKIGK